jgi:hypothetical protein
MLCSTEVSPFQLLARDIDTHSLDIVWKSPERLCGTELLTEKEG